ncbi:hypothetical protein C2857_000860 [Epichloe festucae Fl1]|uniref:Ring-like domain-containing protein n=1 Tax=Epichloe festucae (strain Fl1) TaxID=877507 RepID=A0A7U3Q2B5_EPIFF|nr:hypothetical protein C2857_000860 [Epichloe festucae Fl1]
MIEYFTYKKAKKHKAEKAAKEGARKEAEASRLSETGPIDVADASRAEKHHRHTHDNDHDRAVIRPGDESFLEELIASDDAQGPPLPPRLYSRDLDWPSDNEDASARPSIQTTTTTTTTTDTCSKDKEAKKQGRLSSLFSRKKQPPNTLLRPNTPAEQEKEEKDLSKVLDRLNLSVKNNKVISTDSSAAITSFTNVFKDLVNGVPTAYDDLMSIIEDKDGALAKGFDKLPNSLKKLVTQLPEKITSTLGPELLAAAAASQGIKAETSGGLKGTAKNVFMPANLTQLVTKPGAIVGMLKAIVGVLRTRWPAFIGLNVIWGVALSLLLFVLWYCHKRGREIRLESERSIDGSDRIEELPDDLALPAPEDPRRVETLLDEVETLGEARRQKGKARAEACQV